MEAEVYKCPYATKRITNCEQTFDSEEEASRHVIRDHIAEPYHRTQEGLLLCLYTKEFGHAGCRETFTTGKAALEHFLSTHKNEPEPLPCPLSNDCELKCYSLPSLVSHVDKFHRNRNTVLQCPWAGCDEVYESPGGLRYHIEGKHKEGKRLPCPYKDKGCTKTFTQLVSVNQHVESAHEGKRYECLDKDCKKTFTALSSARFHFRADHQGIRHPCPFKDKLGCLETFKRVDEANKHAKQAHKGHRFPCPFKERDDCEEDFPDQASVGKHVKLEHQPNRIPCPGSEEHKCPKMFKDDAEAQAHWRERHGDNNVCQECGQTFRSPHDRKVHELTHSHHFVCPRLWCNQRFDTWEEALKHAERQDHEPRETFYTCPVPNCRMAVTGRVVPKRQLNSHWRNHVKHGHVSDRAELVYEPAEQLPFRPLPLFAAIFEHNAHHYSEHDGTPEDDGAAGHDQGKLAGTEDGDIAEDEFDVEEEDEVNLMEEERGELFSKEHRSQILAQNEEYFEQHKHQTTNLQGRGHICTGPGLNTRHFIQEPCPAQVVIDLDTAMLRQRQSYKGARVVTLDIECVACRPIKRSRLLLRHLDSLKDKMARFDLKSLRKTFESAARRQWIRKAGYERILERIQEIEDGKRPGSDLVILDDEFTIAGAQLMEFAAIEAVSGKTLINTLVEHPGGITHTASSREILPKESFLSRVHAAGVYSRGRTLSRLGVHQAAAKIRESGITPDTLVLVWHQNTRDLKLLREFLATGGYEGYLPDINNCIPLQQFFRYNLPKMGREQKLYPVKLEVLFPVVYPRSPLVGRNHQALIDCQQTRLLCQTFDELCKPCKDRPKEWQPDNFSKVSVGSILEFFPEIDGKKRKAASNTDSQVEEEESPMKRIRGGNVKDT